MRWVVSAAFAAGTGYAVWRSEYAIAVGVGLFAMLELLGRIEYAVIHRVGILEQYLDALVQKDTD